MVYLWFKSFHLIGGVVWFAGLFYLVRLFIYHVEAGYRPEPAQTILKQQYQVMEKRLYRLITTPGMVVTVAMAIGLLMSQPSLLTEAWLHGKLALVMGLLVYHFFCGWLMRQLSLDLCGWSSQQLRALNEVPTLILVAVVLLAVFKAALPVYTLAWVLGGLALGILVFIRIYAWRREALAQISEEPLQRESPPTQWEPEES